MEEVQREKKFSVQRDFTGEKREGSANRKCETGPSMNTEGGI